MGVYKETLNFRERNRTSKEFPSQTLNGSVRVFDSYLNGLLNSIQSHSKTSSFIFGERMAFGVHERNESVIIYLATPKERKFGPERAVFA
jgi:hypothetical protein